MVIDILSSREREVLSLSMDGLTSKEIARILNLSFRTIEVHRQHILCKTNCKNIIHVVGQLYREQCANIQ